MPVTEDQKTQARRDYQFNLEPDGSERCSCCEHRRWREGSSYCVCTLLDIAIANPSKSACPLFQDDGIPF